MNPWFLAAIVLLVCIVSPFVVCSRGDPVSRLVGLEAGSNMVAALLLLLAVAFGRDLLTDMALALALLSFGGGLVFARFLERWF